ncbi:MAG: hypothetical protein D6706_13615, partial [Chloroflexi bacterium]
HTPIPSPTPTQSDNTPTDEQSTRVSHERVAIAQAQPETTPATGYPIASPTPLPPASGYPAGSESLNSSPNPTAYPPGFATMTAVPVIGGNNDTPSNTTSNTTPDNPVTGRVFLWLSFLIGLVVFLGAVYGAILLFRRRQE